MGIGERSDRAVPRSRDRCRSRCTCMAASHRQADREPGERHQVLRARWIFVGFLPVRDRDGLRHAPVQHQLHGRSSTSFNANIPKRCATIRDHPCRRGDADGRSRPSRSAAVPFHFWTPGRVPRCAPTPVTVVHGICRQGCGVRGDVARVDRMRCRNWHDDYRPIVWAMAVVTVVVGCGDRRSCRPTSNECWPSRRSATPGSSSSGSRRHRHHPGRPRHPTSACLRRCCTCCCTGCWSCGTFAVVSPWSARTGDNSTDLGVVPRARQSRIRRSRWR